MKEQNRYSFSLVYDSKRKYLNINPLPSINIFIKLNDRKPLSVCIPPKID